MGPGEATMLMMYDDTTEGTPISPTFDTPEELAHWLADAKKPSMLMRVIGIDKRTGEYKTRYAYSAAQPPQWQRKVWRNHVQYLHDPARFGIKVPPNQYEGKSNNNINMIKGGSV